MALVALVAAVFAVFAWPSVNSAPRDLPIGVAGPAPAVAQVQQRLGAAAPGTFEVQSFADEAALRTAITQREVYGGLALASTPTASPQMYVATGGSPVVAAALTQLAGTMGQQLSQAAGRAVTIPVTDLAPLPAGDPRGAGLPSAALPLLLGGMLPGIAFSQLFRRRPWLQVAGLTTFAAVAGVTVAGMVTGWLGVVEAGFWPLAGAVALGVAAIGFAIAGAATLFGRVGLALVALVVFLLGNPLSALASAPQMLPHGLGTLGQLLPPGASGTLLRCVAYFDGAGAGHALTVLATWTLAGAALLVIAAVRGRRPAVSAA